MVDDQSFKFSFFGGFNKKSVVDYVAKIVDNFNLEIENLKKDYEGQLEQKDEKILALSTSLQNRDETVKRLESELEGFKQVSFKSGDSKELQEKEALIAEMRKEIEDLKKASSGVKSGDSEKSLENRFKMAQTAAKERINEIIEQARSKIAIEYRKKMEASEKEGRALKNEAVKEASKILNNSAIVAQKMVSDSKDKIKNFVEMAKKEVKDMVDYANLVGQRIIKKSAEVVLFERKNGVVNKFSLDAEVKRVSDTVESDFKLDDELFGAAKKLNADFLLGDEIDSVKVGLDSYGKFKKDEVRSEIEG